MKPGVEWARKDIAEIFGIAALTVTQWVKKPGFPDAIRRGRAFVYPSLKVISWYVNQEISRIMGPATGKLTEGSDDPVEVLNLQQERARLARVQSEQKELDLAEKRGEVVDAGDARQALSHAFGAARSILLSTHAKCAETYPELPTEVVEAIRQMHHDALTALADTPLPGAALGDGNGPLEVETDAPARTDP